MPNAVLVGYGLEQPSFRHRMRSLMAPLREAGWQVRAEQFPSGRYGLRTWERRHLLRAADVVVLHQIKLSAFEARLLGALSRRRVFDVDVQSIVVARHGREQDDIGFGDRLGESRRHANPQIGESVPAKLVHLAVVSACMFETNKGFAIRAGSPRSGKHSRMATTLRPIRLWFRAPALFVGSLIKSFTLPLAPEAHRGP